MKYLFCFLMVVALFLLATPVVAQQDADASAKPVIIDTDMAVDDWMAILYMLQRQDVNVLAVTITGTGEAHCDPGIQNAMNLVALAGNPDIPVACGREVPMQGTNTFPQEWRDWVDSMAGLTLDANPNTPVKQTAVELLSDTIAGLDEKVTLLTLGPLTNIAELVGADPTIVDRLEMIYVMGGAVDVPGNLQPYVENEVAEWNIYVDPLAAEQVLESGAPMTFVGLDATNQAPLTLAFYKQLAEYATTPEADFVYRILTPMIGFIQSGGYYFWDPLSAVTTTDESVVGIQERAVRIITDEGAEFGRIVPDDSGYPVRVAVDADANRFEQIFLNVLNGHDPLAALEPITAAQPEMLPPASAPVESAAEIVGTWRFESALFHFQFRDDGTYRANQTLAGLNADSPEDVGTYAVKDGVLTLTSGEATRFCAPGDVGVYQLNLRATGQLTFVVQDDACSMRNPASTAPQIFDAVSADGTALAFPTGTFASELYSMILNTDGTFSFGTLDGQPITTGTFAIKRDTLEWTSGDYCSDPATYNWAFENDALTFAPIGEDTCADRLASLSTPFTKP